MSDPDQPKTACDYANSIKNDPVKKDHFKRALDSAKLSPNKEYALAVNANGAMMQSGGNSASVVLPLSNAYKNLYAIHSHTEGGYPIFSFGDVASMWKMVRDDKIDPNNFFLGVVHPDGSPYMLTITDPDAFSNFCKKYDKAFQRDGDKGVLRANLGFEKKYYKKAEDEGILSDAEAERIFLLFLTKEKTGLSVSKGETSSGFESWETIKVDAKTPNTVQNNPCPEDGGPILLL